MEPPADCALCPRLAAFRQNLQLRHPDRHHRPALDRGDRNGWFAIVDWVPGTESTAAAGGAHTLLHAILDSLGFMSAPSAMEEGGGLRDVLIAYAVRCAAPANRPVPAEAHACRPFLKSGFADMPNLQVVLALGEIAHQSAVKALGGKLPKARFAHGAVHRLPSGVVLVDSYHCSRLNLDSGRLTEEMFRDVVKLAVDQRSSTSRA